MRIANPIYDAVFKYLMEDTDIAKGLISEIIGEEIVDLELKPQEHFSKKADQILIFRLDFKAIIKTSGGHYKKVLIELQKSKHLSDIVRFRKYLGENYRKEDEIKDEKGQTSKVSLPIITIYFLGFKLENAEDALLQKIVDRLIKASADEEVLQQIELEEEMENLIDKHIREKEDLKEELSVKDQALLEKDQALLEKDQALLEKEKLIEELKKKLKNDN
jgi:hypothetical protein